MENNGLEQNVQPKPMSLLSLTIITGFVGGILWSSVGYFAYAFHFTEIPPNIVLEPWALGKWKSGWIGSVFSIFVIGLFSILAALIYYLLLRKSSSILTGIVYGALLFLLVFFVLNPVFPGMEPVKELKRDTIITSVCLFILYGTFVGYSISYEYEEEQTRKQLEGKTSQS